MPPGDEGGSAAQLIERSGSRLRPLALRTSDGGIVRSGIYRDTATGGLCSIQLTGSGWACFPVQLGALPAAPAGLVSATLTDWP